MKENAKKRRRSNDENEDENGAKRPKKSLIGYNDSRAINLNVVKLINLNNVVKLVGASDVSAKIGGGILTRLNLDITQTPKARSGGLAELKKSITSNMPPKCDELTTLSGLGGEVLNWPQEMGGAPDCDQVIGLQVSKQK